MDSSDAWGDPTSDLEVRKKALQQLTASNKAKSASGLGAVTGVLGAVGAGIASGGNPVAIMGGYQAGSSLGKGLAGGGDMGAAAGQVGSALTAIDKAKEEAEGRAARKRWTDELEE